MAKFFDRSNLPKVLLHALAYFILFVLPVLFRRNVTLAKFHGVAEGYVISSLEAVYAMFVITVIFWLLSINKKIYLFSLSLFFAIGAASTYYVYNFSRTLSPQAVREIFENESSLVLEFMPPLLIISIILSILFFFLTRNLKLNKAFSNYFLILLLLSASVSFGFDCFKNQLFVLRSSIQSYMPTNVFYSMGYYFINYYLALNDKEQIIDISQKHNFRFQPDIKGSQIVVMVIGESMRGDILSINGYKKYHNTPKLESLDNFISFTNARAFTNLTRESVPLMLTHASGENFETSLKETSVISVFHKLGFATSWIGNQRIISDQSATFGSIANEADTIITGTEIRNLSGQKNNYDKVMVPLLRDYLKQNGSKNAFIVIHAIGSHWKFDQRYPAEFMKFKPTCASDPGLCSNEEILNGYNNTILYADSFLYDLISVLKDKNAILFFASDHGLSLMENGYFGNGNQPRPKEELDIAMFAWMSDEYLKHNKRLFQSLAANKNQPITHDHIFHTILGCSNIKSDIIDPKLNICSNHKAAK